MSLEVKGIIEAFSTVCAEVPLDIIVTLHVAIQHALVGEGLLADVTGEEVSIGTVPHSHLGARMVFVTASRKLGLQAGRSGHTSAPSIGGKWCPPSRGHSLCCLLREGQCGNLLGHWSNFLLGYEFLSEAVTQACLNHSVKGDLSTCK